MLKQRMTYTVEFKRHAVHLLPSRNSPWPRGPATSASSASVFSFRTGAPSDGSSFTYFFSEPERPTTGLPLRR